MVVGRWQPVIIWHAPISNDKKPDGEVPKEFGVMDYFEIKAFA